MYDFSLQYLRCVRCSAKLDLEILSQNTEINEGFLICKKCKFIFPIISKIPILWNDFASYLSYRASLGGSLYHASSNQKLKSFVKKSLPKKRQHNDRTKIEKRWTEIYQNSKASKFYS